MAIWDTKGYEQIIDNKIEQGKKKKITAKLALLIPHTGFVTIPWAMSLRKYILPTFVYMCQSGSPIDVSRNIMVNSILEHNVEWIFFLDSDNMGDPNSIQTLISIAEQKKIDIVSGLYWAHKREPVPNMPCAWKIQERKGKTISPLPLTNYKFVEDVAGDKEPLDFKSHVEKGSVIKCDFVGMGCCLIKTEVFRKLKNNYPDKPFFEWGIGKPHLDVPSISEDFYFLLRCIDELGIHPYVATSVPFGHIMSCSKKGETGEYVLADTYTHK